VVFNAVFFGSAIVSVMIRLRKATTFFFFCWRQRVSFGCCFAYRFLYFVFIQAIVLVIAPVVVLFITSPPFCSFLCVKWTVSAGIVCWGIRVLVGKSLPLCLPGAVWNATFSHRYGNRG
jgi:hypothetical protein